jgi:hypothetical protein
MDRKRVEKQIKDTQDKNDNLRTEAGGSLLLTSYADVALDHTNSIPTARTRHTGTNCCMKGIAIKSAAFGVTLHGV